VLGPLAVDSSCRELGLGGALMRAALDEATALGHGTVILLGDAAYYTRFGFSADKMAGLALPGPFERDRLLGLELIDGALDDAAGLIVATGALAKPASAARPRLRRAA
jgi:predicted N-acetyltransferase YhbS